MKEKKWKLHKGSAPIKRILLRHIGNRSDHRSDRRDAGADAKQFCGACAAQDLAGHHDLAAGLHLALRSFGHHTVHVDDIRISLAGVPAVSSRGVDVISHALALDIAHGVGVHHGTVYLHRGRVLWQDEAVALAEHDVGVAVGIGQGLVELYAHWVCVGHMELLYLLLLALLSYLLQRGARCLARGERHQFLLQLLFLHLQCRFHAFALGLVGPALKPCATYVGEVGGSAGCFHEVGQACLPVRQRVGAGERHFAVNAHVLLHGIARVFADVYLIERLEHEALLAVDDKAVFQGERIGLGDDAVCGQRLGVTDPPCHIHLHG